MKHKVNKNYFNDIDCEEKSYLLGFLFADGCIYKGGYQMSLSLNEVDKNILFKFKKFLNYTGPIRHRKQQSQYQLLINNKFLCSRLIELGCTPKKTYNIKYPIIDEGLNRHFIRGVFDGDGCVYLNKKNKDTKSTIVGSSCDFLERIKFLAESNNIKSSIKDYGTYYVLTFSGNNNCYKFLHWIYDDSKIFLKRKMDKFLKSEKLINENVKRHRHRRPVLIIGTCGETIKEYESAVHAERDLGVKYQNIRFCCDNPKRTAGGFKWRWK